MSKDSKNHKFTRVNSIDFKNTTQLESFEQMAKLNKSTFVQARLGGLSQNEQANYLHTTILELQTANKDPKNSPIVQAFEEYMLSNGHTQESLDKIKADAYKATAQEKTTSKSTEQSQKKGKNQKPETLIRNKTITPEIAILQNDEALEATKELNSYNNPKQGILKQTPTEPIIKQGYTPELSTIQQVPTNNIGAIEKFTPEISKAGIQELDNPAPAKDSFIFGSTAAAGAEASQELDAITEAVRKEILLKQQKMLQDEIAKNAENEAEKNRIVKFNVQEFKDYLKTNEGKEKATQALNNKEFQEKLNVVETIGYKAVHEKFKDKFKDVSWNEVPPTTRITKITTNAEISETTHNMTPQTVTLSNGLEETVSSYRTIKFPTDLKGDAGPLHLSMAVKDKNGNNISENDAVYFTAHYDKEGKLTEVSSPIPVKFMGDGPDAVGYIERNGQIYTLPVTHANYQEMMKEVELNGMNVNLAQGPGQNTTPPEQSKQHETQPPKLPMGKPVGITLVTNETPEQTTKRIDNALKGKTDKEVVEILKKEVASGKIDVVGKIVEAIDPARKDKPTDIPTLTTNQYKEIYMHGMKTAAPNAKDQFHQFNIHKSSGKLAEKAQITNQFHINKIQDNAKQLSQKQPGKTIS